jgi:histidinol-phosphate aminotransferase
MLAYLVELSARVAQYLGASPGQVLLGHGSYDLLYTTLAAVLEPGRRAVIPQPSFPAYRQFAELHGAEVVEAGMNDELQYDNAALADAAKDAHVVVLASPNNPTGAVIDPTDLEHLVQTSGALFIVDEAYFDFHGESAVELTASCRNLCVLRTFSKGFSAAGLRIGALVCHADAKPLFEAARVPYSVNVFAMAAAEAAIDHAGALRVHVEEIKRERERVTRLLKARRGVKVYPSRSNFLLFETDRPAQALWQSMVGRGVLVRDVSRMPRLDRALRVTIGRPEENDSFLKALEFAITEVPPV